MLRLQVTSHEACTLEVGSSELIKNYPDKLLYEKKVREWREIKGMDLTETKGSVTQTTIQPKTEDPTGISEKVKSGIGRAITESKGGEV